MIVIFFVIFHIRRYRFQKITHIPILQKKLSLEFAPFLTIVVGPNLK